MVDLKSVFAIGHDSEVAFSNTKQIIENYCFDNECKVMGYGANSPTLRNFNKGTLNANTAIYYIGHGNLTNDGRHLFIDEENYSVSSAKLILSLHNMRPEKAKFISLFSCYAWAAHDEIMQFLQEDQATKELVFVSYGAQNATISDRVMNFNLENLLNTPPSSPFQVLMDNLVSVALGARITVKIGSKIESFSITPHAGFLLNPQANLEESVQKLSSFYNHLKEVARETNTTYLYLKQDDITPFVPTKKDVFLYSLGLLLDTAIYKDSAFISAFMDQPHLWKDFVNQPFGTSNEYAYPLHIAVKLRHKEMVQQLLDNGADVNQINDRGINPLGQAVYHYDVQITEILLAHPEVEVDYISAEDILTPLCKAVRSLMNEELNPIILRIIELLLKRGANPNHLCYNTASLEIAIYQRNTGAIKLLLAYGANISERLDSSEYVRSAAKENYIELFTLFADHKLVFDESNNYGQNLLEMTIEERNVELTELLLSMGGKIPGKVWIYHPLVYALNGCDMDLFQLLLKHGVNTDININGKGLCIFVIENKCVESVPILLDYGVDIFSIRACDTTLLKRLFYNVNFHIKDIFGPTLLEIATQEHCQTVIDLLTDHGVEIPKHDDHAAPFYTLRANPTLLLGKESESYYLEGYFLGESANVCYIENNPTLE